MEIRYGRLGLGVKCEDPGVWLGVVVKCKDYNEIHRLLPLRLKVLLWTLRLKVETLDRYWTGLFTASAEAPHCWGCPRTFSDESSP